jgi:GNAT superfamily N-acetyltransferase
MSIAEIIEDEPGRPPISIRVRQASLRDYEELCALFDELDEIHRQARPDMFQPFPPPARTREQIAHWLAQPESTVLVAQSEDGVVGLAVLLTRAPSGFAGAVPRRVVELDNLVVRADQRGRKVGRRLLAAAVEWSRQRRATHVEVAVHDFNRDARRFYEGFGFSHSIDRLVLAA